MAAELTDEQIESCVRWMGDPKGPYFNRIEFARAVIALATQQATQGAEPVDMVLHCPACGMQHIDAMEYNSDRIDRYPAADGSDDPARSWDNPPHRSHLCHGCSHIWRPADVPTNGVQAVKTKGKADSPIATAPPAHRRGGEEGCAV